VRVRAAAAVLAPARNAPIAETVEDLRFDHPRRAVPTTNLHGFSRVEPGRGRIGQTVTSLVFASYRVPGSCGLKVTTSGGL